MAKSCIGVDWYGVVARSGNFLFTSMQTKIVDGNVVVCANPEVSHIGTIFENFIIRKNCNIQL